MDGAAPASPRLDHCPQGLPRAAYVAADWFAREMATVFAREWVCAGHLADLSPGTLRPVTVGTAPVILARTADGAVAAWHNACRHRGAELCAAEAPLGRLIRCPYHAWAYDAGSGRLVSTGPARPTADFRPEDHGLLPVAVRVWRGFVFLSLASDPAPLRGDVALEVLANWPLETLATGHFWQKDIACNWKLFWENYSECLHCPGLHPELSDLVPVYRGGIMAANEAAGWQPGDAAPPSIRPGARSWTADGDLCGPAFPGLTEAERAAGFSFVTLWPSAFVVAHPDYVRSVRLQPLAPDRTRLTATWHFAPETLARPGFDAEAVAAFARLVMTQDAGAAEMNQRGLASPAFDRARLMPEEYEIARFHRWLLARMGGMP